MFFDYWDLLTLLWHNYSLLFNERYWLKSERLWTRRLALKLLNES